MKKHILGLAIFSLIIGTAVFVSSVFYKQAKREYVYEVSSRSCWKKVNSTALNKPNSLKITQAVFNSNTKHLDIEFATPEMREVEIRVIYPSSNQNSKYLYQFSKNIDITPNSLFRANESIILPEIDVSKLQKTDTMFISIENKFETDNAQSDARYPVLIVQK